MGKSKLIIDTEKLLKQRDELIKIKRQIDDLYNRQNEININSPHNQELQALLSLKKEMRKMSKIPESTMEPRAFHFSWDKDILMISYYVGRIYNTIKVDDLLNFDLEKATVKEKEDEIAKTRKSVETFQRKAEAAQKKLNRLKASEQL